MAESVSRARAASARRPVHVIDVVGLTPRLLEHMPSLRRVSERGFGARLDPVFPAVTTSVQSSMLTGLHPKDHGIVGNGWFFRDLAEVHFWKQNNGLVAGEKLWHAAHKSDPDYSIGNLCWWYAMGMEIDTVLTPRPMFHYDGSVQPDIYTRPDDLRVDLQKALGTFPLPEFWSPLSNIKPSRWLVDAALRMLEQRPHDMMLLYIPHLDYDLQRYGADGPEAIAAARELDGVLAPLIDALVDRDHHIVIVSEYGLTSVGRPVDINRALRREGLLNVYSQHGKEFFDPHTSAALAVADHQAAHVYVRDPAVLDRVRSIIGELPGVDEVLDRTQQAKYHIDHERAGELVAIAEPDAWFTYYYWLDDDRAPDWAQCMDFFKKPGYDPAELFFDPADPLVKVKGLYQLARMKLGMRAGFNVVPLDPSCVGGSHGRLPDRPEDGPVVLCSDARFEQPSFHATEIKNLLLRVAGLPVSDTARKDT
ncbi:alkaline phosphatase family protein [Streptomyces acidiscabies]|uniref:Alkaline phosphatase family protein n=1 Tax=Streptomyces acidiscabies TaxID=42234 RepID=A0AAP6B9J7_9ACTN|nr:nucleotide pyrophosphatase/phosphodiesterase family protein [Streptomyces acidiscabies]MBZ3916051.1 alkaline phosphatase family protein [Streptomyces acidiscabies]MDX2960442.1 alkaline phosphatase family protein [Streptomyces acidiscabies]MDX3017728.1 alkaline phosphatase family protein [Streptomyces acidiscabies]MDX3794343.1 alkaline phosphatase family protein [Streptomyces acidiscabies]GAQ50838.1 type I phosphodiesterase / nucleotide pyrophosphatase [Streptomyces acidiscabies]